MSFSSNVFKVVLWFIVAFFLFGYYLNMGLNHRLQLEEYQEKYAVLDDTRHSLEMKLKEMYQREKDWNKDREDLEQKILKQTKEIKERESKEPQEPRNVPPEQISPNTEYRDPTLVVSDPSLVNLAPHSERYQKVLYENGDFCVEPIYIPRRRFYPQVRPQVCLAFLSCGRYDLLERTMASVIDHMEQYETGLTYEVAIVENCNRDAGAAFVERISKRFQIERISILRTNYGIAAGLNTLFFGLCRAPYILSVEDDWVWRPDRSGDKAILTAAYDALESDPSLIGIILREARSEVNTSWIKLSSGAEYRYLENPSNPGIVVYVNGGILLSKYNLQVIGALEPESRSDREISEENYKARTLKKGFKSGIIKLIEQDECNRWPQEKYSTDCHSVIRHIGGGRRVLQIE